MIKAFVCGRAGGTGHSSVHTCVLTLSCESRMVGRPGVKEFEFLKPFFVSHGFMIKLLRGLDYIVVYIQ